jgi:hypothetical protein
VIGQRKRRVSREKRELTPGGRHEPCGQPFLVLKDTLLLQFVLHIHDLPSEPGVVLLFLDGHPPVAVPEGRSADAVSAQRCATK